MEQNEKSKMSSTEENKKFELITYLSASVFWYIVGKQYFPFGLHSRLIHKPQDIFKELKRTLNLGNTTQTFSKIMPYYSNVYDIKEICALTKNESFKYSEAIIKQGTPAEKNFVQSALPTVTQNGATQMDLKSTSTRVHFCTVDQHISKLIC